MDATERYMRLLLAHEQRIYSFIHSLVQRADDADEVMQETTSTLWQKFGEYEAGTNFGAWATQVAYFKVLEHRRRVRTERARLGDGTLAALKDRFVEAAGKGDARREALQGCLSGLSEADREIIRLRYQPDGDVRRAAKTVGRSVDAVYKALNRIHRRLFECVRGKLAAEGGA